MEARKKLAESLNTLDGFKALFSGLFGGGKAKKSFEIYSSAPEKGVFDLLTLRNDEHNDYHYAVFAFSKKGTIDVETRQTLTERARELPLGTIRYESISYGKLELWRSEGESFANQNKTITTLAPEWPDIFVFPVAEGKAEKLDCPYIIYAHKDDGDYVYPIATKKLK